MQSSFHAFINTDLADETRHLLRTKNYSEYFLFCFAANREVSIGCGKSLNCTFVSAALSADLKSV